MPQKALLLVKKHFLMIIIPNFAKIFVVFGHFKVLREDSNGKTTYGTFSNISKTFTKKILLFALHSLIGYKHVAF